MINNQGVFMDSEKPGIASDHVTLLKAIMRGQLRIMLGWFYINKANDFPTAIKIKLDEYGCPALTDEIRKLLGVSHE
jgi:hypothetical protein